MIGRCDYCGEELEVKNYFNDAICAECFDVRMPKEDYSLCPDCNGIGEGMCEDKLCFNCNGKGTI